MNETPIILIIASVGLEDVRILGPRSENGIGNLVLEPKVSVHLRTEVPPSVVGGVCVFAESHLIVVVFREEGTIKRSYGYHRRVWTHWLGMDIHFGDGVVALRPSLVAVIVVFGIMDKVGWVLVELMGSGRHDGADLVQRRMSA